MFLTTSFSTTLNHFIKSTETVFNLSRSKSSTFIFKLFKLVETLVSLFLSSLSTSAFKVIKPFLAAISNVSMPVVRYNSF